jgi:hypothetical protein
MHHQESSVVGRCCKLPCQPAQLLVGNLAAVVARRGGTQDEYAQAAKVIAAVYGERLRFPCP